MPALPMWLVYLLLVLLVLRWTVLTGYPAMITSLPAADWIAPIAVISAGFATVDSFGWFLVVMPAYYILGMVMTLFAVPLFIMQGIIWRFLDVIFGKYMFESKNMFQTQFYIALKSTPIIAAVDCCAFWFIAHFIPAFHINPFSLKVYALLLVLCVFNRILALKCFANINIFRFTYSQLWNLET
jgi:hypothetical protein